MVLLEHLLDESGLPILCRRKSLGVFWKSAHLVVDELSASLSVGAMRSTVFGCTAPWASGSVTHALKTSPFGTHVAWDIVCVWNRLTCCPHFGISLGDL